MAWWQSLLLIPYCLALGLLLLYGSHRYLIVRLYYRNRHNAPKPCNPPDPWPSVTVQLPVYNERYVVERLIRSVAGLDYPGDRLEVQVLDDSTDDTADLAQACVEALRRDGHAISHVRRGGREGFKAGALAEGSVQTARKLLPGLLRSDLPFQVKAESVFHLTGNLSYLLMALVSVLIFPAILARAHMGWYKVLLVDLPLFLTATFAVSSFYVCSQREIGPAWRSRIKYLPCLMSIGLGISLNNARAVLEALLGHRTPFYRTPKYRIEQPADTWRGKRYRISRTWMPLAELLLGVYFAGLIGFCARQETYFPIPFLMTFGFGFLYVGGMSIWQGKRGGARSA